MTNADQICSLCNNGEEYHIHLFFKCNVSNLIWNCYSVSPCILTSNNFDSVSLYHNDMEELSDLGKVFFLGWQIWNNINNKSLRNFNPSLTRSTGLAILMSDNYLKSNAKERKKSTCDNSTIIKLHPPDNNYFKLNLDGLVAGDKGAAGFVIRSDTGHLTGGEALNFDGATIYEGEARGLREGLLYALRALQTLWWKAILDLSFRLYKELVQPHGIWSLSLMISGERRLSS